MSKLCKDAALREWVNRAPCDGDPTDCKWVVKFGKQEYCGYCPEFVALHQAVKGEAGCIWCQYYTKNLDSAKCLPCLSAPERINFKPDAWALERYGEAIVHA